MTREVLILVHRFREEDATLTELHLDGNQLTDASGTERAAALRTNSTPPQTRK